MRRDASFANRWAQFDEFREFLQFLIDHEPECEVRDCRLCEMALTLYCWLGGRIFRENASPATWPPKKTD